MLTVHGFGFDGCDVSQNPFGSLTIPDDDSIHVAVAHGSERGHQPPEKACYAPFHAGEAAVAGLPYLALGHFHSVTQLPGDFDTVMYYCGSPEGLGFGEQGLHHYLEVKIDDGETEVTKVPSSIVGYEQHSIDCSTFTSSQELVDALRNLPRVDGYRRIVRVKMEGICLPEIRSAMPAAQDALAAEFENLELMDMTVAAEDYEELAREQTSLGDFIRKMNKEYERATDDARRRFVARSREVGLAALRGRDLPIRGLERG